MPKKKILIVDDSEFIRSALAEILSPVFRIVSACSGKTALDQHKKEKPDLTLLDIIMPEGEEEGVRVLENIRKASPEAKVIMLSAVGQKAVIEKCRDLGAEDYLIKPFEEDDVLKKVTKYLS